MQVVNFDRTGNLILGLIYRMHSRSGSMYGFLVWKVYRMIKPFKPWLLWHRVQLHEALKRQAVASDGLGPPVVLEKAAKVCNVDAETTTITLQNGTKITGDLVLRADGVGVSDNNGIQNYLLRATTNFTPSLSHEKQWLVSISNRLAVEKWFPIFGSMWRYSQERPHTRVCSRSQSTRRVVERLWRDIPAEGSICVGRRPESSFPTLHGIISGLSEIPVYDILAAKMEKGYGFDDYSRAQR